MGIRMIAMDLDGTVLRSNQTIHPSLTPAFSRAQASGLLLVIATGRAFQSTKRIIEPFAFPGPLICSNGSQVLNDRHETIGTEFLDLESQSEISTNGHVEIRWSHGKFCGAPESKIYLDTPHVNACGYVSI